MTEEQAQAVEQQWSAYQSKKQTLTMLSGVGLGDSDLRAERLRGAASDRDAMVALLTRMTEKSGNPHQRKMAHGMLAMLAKKEGMPFLHHLIDAARWELMHHRKAVEMGVVVGFTVSTPGADRRVGEQCSRRAGRVFSFAEAVAEKPLPCGTECVCSWRPVLCSDRLL